MIWTAACITDRRCMATRLVAMRTPVWLLALALILAATETAPAFQSADPPADASETSPGSAVDAPKSVDVPGKSSEPIDLSFDDLKFDIEKGADFKDSMLTEALKNLDGKKVRLRGFVRPGFKQTGIKNFILVRDNQECCFGPGAALYDCVMVKMSEDQSIDFTVRPISVVGTMQLKKYVGKDGKIWAIFRLNETRAE